jgi:hypothetical protein
MNEDLIALAVQYKAGREEPDLRRVLEHLSEAFQLRREAALLDSVSTVGAAYGILLADRVDVSAVDEQMLEALELVYRCVSLLL